MAPAIPPGAQRVLPSPGKKRAICAKIRTSPTIPESRRIFQRDGNFYKQYEIFRQPELARTLERIAKNPDDFYRGAMARELAAAIQQGGGLATAEDLARYQVKEREPLRGTYRGYEVISAPPPSSGGTVLIETLNILEGYDLAKAGSRSAESVHLTAEAFRRAFFDRAEFLGDPDFSMLPLPNSPTKNTPKPGARRLIPTTLHRAKICNAPRFLQR